MKRTALKIFLTLLTVLFVFSCAKTDAQSQKKGIDLETPPVTVKVEKVQPKELQLYAEITGKLEGITDIVYYSEVSGKVKSIEKKLGDQIKKGEPIAFLDSKNFEISYEQAKSELKSAEAGLDAVRIKLETTQKLFESGKVSKYELINDQSILKKSEAAVDGSKANLEKAKLNYENSKFISPVDGFITQINIKQGQFVGVGQAVASIVNNKTLIIKTGVTENDILFVKNGSVVEIKRNGDENLVYGKVTGIGIKPDATGVYPVEIQIKNQNADLLPGMIVKGNILSVKLDNVVYTDFDNVLEEFGKYFVYVVNDENMAVKRKVDTGKKYGNKIIIKSGLESGDRLIISGVTSLSNGAIVRIFGQGTESIN